MASDIYGNRKGSPDPDSVDLGIEIDDADAYYEDEEDDVFAEDNTEITVDPIEANASSLFENLTEPLDTLSGTDDPKVANVSSSLENLAEPLRTPSDCSTLCDCLESSVHQEEFNNADKELGMRPIFTIGDNEELEDEEVEGILKSTDMLNRMRDEIKRSVRDQLSEEAKLYRKRSRSVDDGKYHRHSMTDFAKYGISIGVDRANELLPGIEEFLCSVLAGESLSPYAEEQRQYFLERLDIIKMPPSVPPRPQSLGVNLYPVEPSQIPSSHSSIPSIEQEDFAAYQRELSRALLAETDGTVTPDQTDVKVYDDIEFVNVSVSEDGSNAAEPDEESHYEIPQLKRSLSESGYEKAIDVSLSSKSASTENILTAEVPPPLPPRQERTMSEATLRSSVGSTLEDHTQDLVYKGTASHRDPADTRSERSSDDLLDDNTDEPDGVSFGASCDSLDDLGPLDPETDMLQKLGVQLPRPAKLKKRRSIRRKLGLSLSGLKESTISFRALEDVVLSGELHYHSKLSWTRKLVALTNGRLVCYKRDKPDSRPSHIVVLNGYNATFRQRDGKLRGFEITLSHDMFESYSFLSDFKEWAEIWCEHMNAASEGKKALGPVLHLARGSAIVGGSESEYNLGKVNQDSSSSSQSLASVCSDGFDYDPGTVKVKKRDVSGTKTTRMGGFAFKATQFFESLGKKSSLRKSSSTDVYRQTRSESLTSLSETPSPLTPEAPAIAEEKPPLEVAKYIKHQGYLDIYSSFNKRKWGKRWCMVHENSFECYRTPTSEVCELEFLLRSCVLRRAIEETKSELGLMLVEDQREKLTIEPLNWTELGSWLRILMQETSTPTVPDGLQGYMDDSNPYHEPVEITRLSDPFPASPPVLPAGLERTVASKDIEDDRPSTSSRNRDSGNCSAESMFGSLERRSNDNKTNPSNTDSGLSRVNANGSSDVYTQVRKPSKRNKTWKNQTSSKNSNTVDREPDFSADSYGYDFSATVPSMKPGESLMDEIMSQFNSQLSVGHDVNKDENVFNFDNIPVKQDNDSRKPRKPSDAAEKLSEIENVVSPIKNIYNENPETATTENQVHCSSFVEESFHSNKSEPVTVGATDLEGNHASRRASADVDLDHCDNKRVGDGGAINPLEDVAVRAHRREHTEHVRRKKSSLELDPVRLQRMLEELRTTLVQLKKDRICIRDRKQKSTSVIDREYLEAEFNRLNRECSKVQEEISYLEKLQHPNAESQHTPGDRRHSIGENQHTSGDKQHTGGKNERDIAGKLVRTTLESSYDRGLEAPIPEQAEDSKVYNSNTENVIEKGIPEPSENVKGECRRSDQADSYSVQSEALLEGSIEVENGKRLEQNVLHVAKVVIPEELNNTQTLNDGNNLVDVSDCSIHIGSNELNTKTSKTGSSTSNEQRLCHNKEGKENLRISDMNQCDNTLGKVDESEKTEKVDSFSKCAIPDHSAEVTETDIDSVTQASEDENSNTEHEQQQSLKVDIEDTNINGAFQELLSAFESKLKIESSESE